MERDQAALNEGLESEESDARHSAHGSTWSRRSRSGSRRLNQIQEAVLRQEAITQRSQDTLNNMTAMMQWQVKSSSGRTVRLLLPEFKTQMLWSSS
ncbi:hypothetical protein L3X38_011877 [Prunus dulcis]|uniref:Uncharacterized protein n=1 Tax=Prunus dulcis TaxID=3755 RepID=A0AAD4WI89_PRUDU|nr:hypothetical protein L3X38_011877 [Prunus dulcis]